MKKGLTIADSSGSNVLELNEGGLVLNGASIKQPRPLLFKVAKFLHRVADYIEYK